MNRILIASIIALASIVGFASTAAAQDNNVARCWKTIDDDTNKPKSIVKVEKKGSKYTGTVVKLFRGEGEDQNPMCTACSGAKKNKPIIGMQILWDLVQDGDEYADGTILDPANGKTYDAKVWREGKNLKVRGYLGFFYRTQTWRPAKCP